MDKNILYYANRNKYNNVCIPKKEGILNYLIKDKFLSEFTTNEEKNRVLDNLGISQLLDNLLELINSKVTLLDLKSYVTISYFLNKLEELKPKDEKSKGFFSSYEELISEYPQGEKGDWSIVSVEGIWYIYRYNTEEGWILSETYDNQIDMTGYVKLSEIEALFQKILVSGENIKTINGESILGSGNIEIKSNTEQIKEEVHNIVYPLTVSASISASTLEYTGQPHNITITAIARKTGSDVSGATYQITYGNITESFNGRYNTLVTNRGTTTFTIKCICNGETATTRVSVNLIQPTYMGFDTTDDKDKVNLSKLSKSLKSSISTTLKIKNDISGSYLWIISPYKVNLVATDPMYFYKVSMFNAGSKDGLQYFRSNSAIDVSNLTYYIK